MSSSKVRIQTYLKRNRVSELFEDMMSKLIQDLPSEPVEYLVQFLQKKLTSKKIMSRDIAELTGKSTRVSSQSNNQDKSSPQKAGKILATVEVDSRHYSKPWLANSKKEKSPSKDKTRQGLLRTAPANLSLESHKETSYLEVDGKKRDEHDIDGKVSLTKVYGKPYEAIENDDSEFICKEDKQEDKKVARHRGKRVSAKEAKKQRRNQLKKSLAGTSNKENRLGNDVISDDDEDDAIELYENADELVEEGVKNPPKTGVYTSGHISHPKEQIELVLNMSKFFDSLGGAVSVASYNNQDGSTIVDDDFESASQVTGPRRPVWEAPDSDVESLTEKPHLMTSRRMDTSMFDVKPPSEPKASSKPASVVKAGSTVSNSAEKLKRKTPSQVSNTSRRSLELTKSPSNVSGGSKRRQDLSKDITLPRTSQERPKTAQ